MYAPLARCDIPTDDSSGAPGSDPLTKAGAKLFCATIPANFGFGDYPLTVKVASSRESRPFDQRVPAIYHPGGPGLSPTQALVEDPPAVDFARFTVLSWDGATASARKGMCGPNSLAYGTSRTVDTYAAQVAVVARECKLGDTTRALTGASLAAEELERIRVMLGIGNVTILAHSYGTAIAEHYLRQYAEHVRLAVLDGPVALGTPWATRVSAVRAALARAVGKLLGECERARCGKQLAELVREGKTYEQVRAEVVAADPKIGLSSAKLTAIVVDQAVLLGLRTTRYWPDLLDALDAALAGDATSLARIGQRYATAVDRANFYQSFCHDIDHPKDAGSYASGSDALLDAFTTELAPCATVPAPAYPAATEAWTPGKPPVLVLASESDPLAPAALLAADRELTSKATVCLTGVVGHTGIRVPSVERFVRDVLVSGHVDVEDSTVFRCRAGDLPD